MKNTAPARLLKRALPRCAVAFVLQVAILVFLSAAAAADSEETTPRRANPDVRSQAFYILDESDSSVVAARNEREPVPIASITKLMTALVVLEAGQALEEKLTIENDELRGTAGEYSRLPSGASLSRGDMLHLALMSSKNRAAHALCRSYPSGTSACVRAMNAKAAALGMTTAHFVEPTGLAKLVIAASGHSTICGFSTDAAHSVRIGRQRLEYGNPTCWYRTPPGRSACRKPATSRRPVVAW